MQENSCWGWSGQWDCCCKVEITWSATVEEQRGADEEVANLFPYFWDLNTFKGKFYFKSVILPVCVWIHTKREKSVQFKDNSYNLTWIWMFIFSWRWRSWCNKMWDFCCKPRKSYNLKIPFVTKRLKQSRLKCYCVQAREPPVSPCCLLVAQTPPTCSYMFC